MSLFASALDAQDGMSVISTEVENQFNQFNDFLEGDRKLDVLQDDGADVHIHGLMATSLMHLRWKIFFL
jgi:hypothetical protein